MCIRDRYAIEQGIPVVSFVHKDPRSLPQRYVEIDAKVNGLFDAFKTDVKKRLCKFWDNACLLYTSTLVSPMIQRQQSGVELLIIAYILMK